MEKIRNNHPEIAPSGATFSRTVRVGNLLFIAGCTARGADAQGGSMLEQLEVTLDRIMRIVAAEGGVPGDIVKITTFVTSVPAWQENRSGQEEMFARYFQGEYPANTLVEITALAEAGLDVEIEAIAELS
ncbi:MAG: RidA family protein [Dehalococcoidia bacterium]|nr:RidA family protein [Dehalococcoidia bacterium]